MSRPILFSCRFLAVLACAVLLVTACDDDDIVSPDGKTTSLQGTIFDEQGRGVPYAVLEVHDSKPSVQGILVRDTTDEEGLFTLKDVPSDVSTMYLRVVHPHFQAYSGKLGDLVRQMDHGRITLALRHEDSCCGRLDLTVRGATDSAALSGVQVKIRRHGHTVSVATTDSLGGVSFMYLCPGEYNFRLAKSGYQVVEQNFVIEDCDSVSLNPYMHNGGSNNDSCCNGVATIIVRDSATASVLPGATVKLWKNGTFLTALTSNGDGRVRFTGLCPGEYGVSILREHYSGREFQFIVACNDTIEQTRSLAAKPSEEDSCCQGRLHIIIRDSLTNAPIQGLKIKLWQGSQLKKQETAGQNGVLFTGLCEGSYGVSVSGEGVIPFEFDVRLACNDSVEVVRTVMRDDDTCCNNRVKIIVRDSVSNEIVPGATVKLWRAGAIVASKTTNNDGVAVFEELCGGTLGVSIIRNLYDSRELTLTLSCSSNEERTVRLRPQWEQRDSCCHGVVKVIVRDSTSNVALGSTLVKLWHNNQIVGTQTTGNDGYVYFTGLCPGNYSVTLIREHYKNREFAFQTGCNDTMTHTRRLLALDKEPDSCKTARLKVRVKDSTVADGGWLQDAIVMISRGGMIVVEGMTNADGWFVGEGLLAPAEYTVTFVRVGYITKTVTFRFSECNTIQETIRIVPD